MMRWHCRAATICWNTAPPRRGREQRVAWSGDMIAGFLLTGETSGARSLIEQIRSATPWPGPRHTIFLPAGGEALRSLAPRARMVCNCKQVTQTQIEEAVAAHAGLDDLKSTLGCGTVCGSCVPEIRRLLNATVVA